MWHPLSLRVLRIWRDPLVRKNLEVFVPEQAPVFTARARCENGPLRLSQSGYKLIPLTDARLGFGIKVATGRHQPFSVHAGQTLAGDAGEPRSAIAFGLGF